MDLKLLWVDVMEVVWVTILSKVANEDKDKARQQELQQELQQQDNDDYVDVDGTNILSSIESSSSSSPITNKNAGAWEAAQKTLAACWPLIAMWPVLYAGYQIEVLLGLEM